MRAHELLHELTSVKAASGREEALRATLRRHADRLGVAMTVDRAGNVVLAPRRRGSGPRVAFVAHLDQVALWVKEVTDAGLVRFVAPAIDPRLLPGLVVEAGGHIGVVGFRPPHLTPEAERSKPAAVESLTVDFGLPPERVRTLVRPGDPLAFHVAPARLGAHRFLASGLDNRASVAAALLALELLGDEPTPAEVAVALTVEEEAGRHGAAYLARDLRPEVAVALDVTFGRAGPAAPGETVPLGSGPAIGLGANIPSGVAKLLREVAETTGVPYQWEVMPGDSGTDAWVVQHGGEGTATGTLSIPLRYMHSAGEVVDLRDVEATARLVAALMRLDEDRWREVL